MSPPLNFLTALHVLRLVWPWQLQRRYRCPLRPEKNLETRARMSVIDILFRVDEICKKYDKYDIEKQREKNAYGDDAFARLYATFESEVDSALQKIERATVEKNRATSVALNAEVRRAKARLLEEIPKLHKLAQKKVKGLSKEELVTRGDLVLVLQGRIEAIPDGSAAAAKQGGGWSTSASHKNIKFDSSADENFDDGFFQQSEESSQFRQEYEMRKIKQAYKIISYMKEITSEEKLELFLAKVDEKIIGSTSKIATPRSTISGFGVASPTTATSSTNTSGTTWKLVEGTCLKNYEYLCNGEVFDKVNKKWILQLPTDSHLLLYLFCSFLEYPKWMLHVDPTSYFGTQSSLNPLL
ncbi:hypothetical protein SAY87_016634 [Trapa incisa]|uniref:Syntaxin-71 n=1 Tax=Trapa incisa TaxID=236973 RepID=A0AAN7QZ88_9MYRT|nr:hypothetical protein SAY87_016634 [Trapa incisa]